ncbi:carbohydrate kinase family protein [Flavihumibacter sp.]|uniref:carbohydrate kinase family protein n=1 Tax=Flavihumibacter sp. TaxID=1913981 RepID=UPI002FC704F7|nr:PfkB family carbohydrate kinase [Flavihumibacter sediminis]
MQNSFVLAIGEALIDAVSTEFVDNLSYARQLEIKPGGSPANFCRFLHQLGTPAQLVAAIGEDGFSKIIMDDMQAKGIDTKYIQVMKEHATTLIVVGKSKGTPDFSAYRDADMQIAEVDDQLINDCSIIHSTAFAMSKLPARETILTAMHKAKGLGKKISIDWNYAENIWGKPNNADIVFRQITELLPLLKFSLDDASRFTGRDLDAKAAIEWLSQFNTDVTCLTCGADGVWFRMQNMNWDHVPAPPVEVRDSTGAGDSFWAGFIHAYLKNASINECINNAISTASKRLQGQL